MWRKRSLLRLAMLSTFALVAVYYTTSQLHTIKKYRNRRKVGSVPPWAPVILVNELQYVGTAPEDDEDVFARHAFNLRSSNELPSDRSLPDTRHARCRDVEYGAAPLQTTSVVVAFHNEDRSALLRTVVSVLNRTPPDLIEEVILVDDRSDDEQDGSLLSSLPKVRVVRNQAREGLIRSRILGALEARGDFLMFLDSHCEVNVGWLEPLLDRVTQNALTVVSPVIDVIDMDTFQYRASSPQLKGGFDWSLYFKWLPLSHEERTRRGSPMEPFLSPAIAGGLFLISRDWFQRLGMFDSGLRIWGAENLEISLKSWLCGGNVEVVPCSRVGHVFRKTHPYTFPGGNADTYLRNTKRVAEVWLGDHKRFFYEAQPNARALDAGSLQEQLEVKSQLDCRPFQWYLENVFPELKLPNEENSAFGQLKQGSQCLQSEVESSGVKLAECNESELSQHSWAFNVHTASIQHGKLCLSVRNKLNLVLETCTQSYQQEWSRHGRAVVLLSSGQCLESGIRSELRLSECRRGAMSQQWDFTVELQAQDDHPVNIT
ncbi:polypeptide N-acetylgalactosaminyltransferase 2-like [Zootermopsis nevadensis]|uniref:Polypeptide N-acetylgalactosaminyltransferase n=1 Tax=Zootermopsis nevadensis TaxID=136037 RepID=A0A067QXX2_ZOONE|nr:polypeptide N-acetylgalactosaminyltransferase 2-like [Zootermopsis nevadensis]KDR14208.1 Polypeptide N-acetylgalactosaminyltransferase 2 [Zootermopsis nevadensis]